MAIKLNEWNTLSTTDKDAVIQFLRRNCKIDLESPKNHAITTGVYPISDGITTGGHSMKYGDEYRIYIRYLDDCPLFLSREFKSAPKPYKARIGGNAAIKAIMDYGGFRIGEN
jgi:hypothetical protein